MAHIQKTLKYAKWLAIYNWSSSTMSVISTSSMLNIIAKPESHSLLSVNYIGKDIIGQLASMFYLWKNSKKVDKQNPLKYITYGCVLQQVGFVIEYSSIFVSTDKYYILPLLGFCNVLKNISFTVVGAINAKNMRNISSDNIGEIYMKITTANTLASTFGLISGITIVNFMPHKYISTLIVPSLSFLSIYTLRKATKVASEPL